MFMKVSCNLIKYDFEKVPLFFRNDKGRTNKETNKLTDFW